MLAIHAYGFIAFTQNLRGLRDNALLPGSRADAFISSFLEEREASMLLLEDMGLRTTGKSFGRLLDDIDAGLRGQSVIDRIARVQETLKDELETVYLYKVDARFAHLMESETPAFGVEVFEAFPSAITDIEQAGRCLAVEQGTASVFHLMRVMEVALKALARSLGVPYAPSWESYLRQIDARIAAKHASKSPAWKKREPFFRDVAGDLQIVKIVWRNPTMHIVRHYTVDEADEIYRAVRTFVKRLPPHVREASRR